MHMKSDFSSEDNFRCCGCFHVRTGTIILGIWHLVFHLYALTILFNVLVNPDTRHKFVALDDAKSHEVNTFLTSEYYSPHLPDISTGPAVNYAFCDEKNLQKDVHVASAVIVCASLMTLFLIYGAMKGKPNYLMPYFTLQVFDFVISALTAIGYFSSVPDVRRMIEETSDVPLKKELLHLNPEWLCAILMVVVVVCMIIKAYFMGIVWSCYKYLKFLHAAQMLDSYIEPDNEALLPPDYDTATKPPPYATTCKPPPYFSAV